MYRVTYSAFWPSTQSGVLQVQEATQVRENNMLRKSTPLWPRAVPGISWGDFEKQEKFALGDTADHLSQTC